MILILVSLRLWLWWRSRGLFLYSYAVNAGKWKYGEFRGMILTELLVPTFTLISPEKGNLKRCGQSSPPSRKLELSSPGTFLRIISRVWETQGSNFPKSWTSKLDHIYTYNGTFSLLSETWITVQEGFGVEYQKAFLRARSSLCDYS
jgi:hypothetical protein